MIWVEGILVNNIARNILNFWFNLLRKFKSFTLLSCGFRIFSWTAESAACFTQSVAASHSFSVVENDLHVLSHSVTIVGNSFAEAVKSLDSGITVRVGSFEGLPVSLLEVATAANQVTEKLRQVLVFSLSLSPLVVLRLPLGSLLLLFIAICWGFFSGSFSFAFDGGNWLLNFFHNSLLDHVRGYGPFGWLGLVLEADHTSNFADATLDGKELIHRAQLHLVLSAFELL